MREMWRIAWPVVVTYLGQMTMGLVDILAVGKVSAEALGAVGVGTNVFNAFMIFGIGLLTGLDYWVSHAEGAGRRAEGFGFLVQACWVAVGLAVPMTWVLMALSSRLGALGINPVLIGQAREYLWMLSLGMMPIFVFTAFRQYLQARSVVLPAMFALLAANIVNGVGNYVLVFGNWGLPAMGAEGSALATLIARVTMVLGLVGYFWVWDRSGDRFFARARWGLQREVLRKLVRLGLPTAMQMVLEVGVFALVSVLAARFAAESMAAHQIVLSLASFTFMVPLAVGSASGVMVGQAMGREDYAGARRCGWNGFALGVGFMVLSCAALLAFPDFFLGLYSRDARVLGAAKGILLVAALFQLFDGTQTVATGVLRGFADTRTPLLANLAGHWLVGLPVGVYLGFYRDWQLLGLWIGLFAGLVVVATALLARWVQRTRALVDRACGEETPC